MSQKVFLILTISAVSVKGNHLRLALREKNKGRIKAELFFLALIVVLGATLILFAGK